LGFILCQIHESKARYRENTKGHEGFQQYASYCEENLKTFLEDIRTGVKSQRAAAADYQCSRSTVTNKNLKVISAGNLDVQQCIRLKKKM
jgi:hypothetical protein